MDRVPSSKRLTDLCLGGLALVAVAIVTGEVGRAADRSVTIFEGADEPGPAVPGGTAAPALVAPDPSAPAPEARINVAPLPPDTAPVVLTPAPTAPVDAETTPASTAKAPDRLTSPALVDPAPVAPGLQFSMLKAINPAGVTVTIQPASTVSAGTRIAFVITTRRPGYLILVDIDAEGRMTQIYPNVILLSRAKGSIAEMNMIAPGAPVMVPNPKNALARFVFTADPPLGRGAIVAMLSDRPVQIVDVPEPAGVAQDLQTQLDMLSKRVLDLKIATSDKTPKFLPGTWSFAAAPYAIE